VPRSLAESSAEVASSKIRTGGFLSTVSMAYYGRWRPLRGMSDGIIFVYEKFQTDVITKCPC